MGQLKGNTGNPAGRPKGVPNKITGDLRQSIQSFLDANWCNVQKEFDQLESRDKLLFIDKLLKYALPTLQATTLTTDLQTLSDEQLDILTQKVLNG